MTTTLQAPPPTPVEPGATPPTPEEKRISRFYLAAAPEEWAERAQMLIRRAQIMRAAPPSLAPSPTPVPNP